MPEQKRYKLIGPDGATYLSDTKGLFGGHRGGRGYGRMDCRAALRAIANGGYVIAAEIRGSLTRLVTGQTSFSRDDKLR